MAAFVGISHCEKITGRSIPVLAAILMAECTGPYSAPTVSAKTEGKPIAVRARAVALETIPEIITATGELSAEDIATINAKFAWDMDVTQS